MIKGKTWGNSLVPGQASVDLKLEQQHANCDTEKFTGI